MPNTVKTTFKLRRGDLSTWEKNNPILEKGEPSVAYKNGRVYCFKIGDGTTPWKSLPAFSAGGAQPGQAPVTSVNGKVGEVQLTAEDVKAVPDWQHQLFHGPIIIYSMDEEVPSSHIEMGAIGEDNDGTCLYFGTSGDTFRIIAEHMKVVEPQDIVNKQYVDNAISTSLSKILVAEELSF